MLLLVDIGNITLCDSLTGLINCDKKYQEITDSKISDMNNYALHFNIKHI